MPQAPILDDKGSTSPVDIGQNANPQNKGVSIGAAVIAAVAALGSAIVGGISQHRTNLTAQERQDEAYRQNLLQWERENAYSSPLAQRRRLEMAGLNPALMYQNGTGSGAAAPSPQLGASVPISPFAAGNMQQAFQQAAMTSAEVANLNADTDKKKSETKNVEIDTELKNVNVNLINYELNKIKPAELKLINSNLKKTDSEIAILNEQLYGVTLDNVKKSLEVDKERFYQHFFMNDDLTASLNLKKADSTKAFAEAAETSYLMHIKMSLMAADIALKREQKNTEFQHGQNYYYDSWLKYQEFKFHNALYKAPKYVKSLVDSVLLQNNLMRIQIGGSGWDLLQKKYGTLNNIITYQREMVQKSFPFNSASFGGASIGFR